LAAVHSGSSPQPIPTPSAGAKGHTIKVPANSVSFALGTSNGSIGDGRPRFNWTIAPGGSQTDFAIVYNISKVPLTLRILAVDANTDLTGNLVSSGDNAARKGVGLWVHPYVSRVTIPALKSEIIPFKVTIPKNAAIGDHGGGFIAATIPSVKTENGKTTVTREARISMPSYVRVSGPLTTRVAFSSFKASFKTKAFKPGFGDLTVKYSIVNTGNVRVTVDQKIAIRGLLGVSARSTTPAPIQQLLPDSKYTGTLVFKHIPASLSIRVTGTAKPTALDPGSPVGNTATASTSVAAISWTAVALVTSGVTVVVLVVLIVLQMLGGGKAAAGKDQKTDPELASVGSDSKSGD
jgi:hypothetical protein